MSNTKIIIILNDEMKQHLLHETAGVPCGSQRSQLIIVPTVGGLMAGTGTAFAWGYMRGVAKAATQYYSQK